MLGIIGAVDPYKHKLNQMVGGGNLDKAVGGDEKGGIHLFYLFRFFLTLDS